MRTINCHECGRENNLRDSFAMQSVACVKCNTPIPASRFEHSRDDGQQLMEHHYYKVFRELGDYERHAPALEAAS